VRLVFRVDAAIYMGSGHVMRCLTLARSLKRRGAEIVFISRELPGHMGETVSEAGFELRMLPATGIASAYHPANAEDAAGWLAVQPDIDASQCADILKELAPVDWLIVDHYGIDIRWESAMRPMVGSVMVIDDLANRKHDCDLLLDQNLLPDMKQRYRGLVSSQCHCLFGPDYALLRDEFIAARRVLRQRNGSIKSILVFMGGMDPQNTTEVALAGLMSLPNQDLIVDIIVGLTNPNRERIASLCGSDARFNFECQIDDMAMRLNRADLVIGAGGSTSWERCLLGVPSILVIMAENQRRISNYLCDLGAVIVAGDSSSLTPGQIATIVSDLKSDPDKVSAMAQAALAVMVGYTGGANEVCNWIYQEQGNG